MNILEIIYGKLMKILWLKLKKKQSKRVKEYILFLSFIYFNNNNRIVLINNLII